MGDLLLENATVWFLQASCDSQRTHSTTN